jgi:hypothetical protein
MAAVDSSVAANGADPADGPRLYSIHNRVLNAVGMVGGSAVAVAVALCAGSWLVRVAALVIAAGLLAWAVRGGLVGVACTPQALVVRELSRTHRVRWDDLTDIGVRADRRFKITAPELRLYNEETSEHGRRLSAMSLADKDPGVVDRHVATLTGQWHSRVADSSG